ncbi:MAG: pirin family protein [Rhodospirillales bacterium]|nr:pirin family protein [Rhodospirillales bacterium]
MSWLTEATPTTSPGPCSPVELVVEPGVKDLGGFRVRRALPTAKRRMVGPFIFFDHMGPVQFAPGDGIDVRPHPHIGLATLTYLASGSILHRDTLGSAERILPGAVNWMTAGRGIAHSERTDPAARSTGQIMQGIQSWVALPRADEETVPTFYHHAAESLPMITANGLAARLIAGEAFGARSPVRTFSAMFYLDVTLAPGAALPLPADCPERAVYLLEGGVEIAGETFSACRLLVFRPDDAISLRALGPARLLALGGEPMDGPRHIWWNFVSSSRDRIEQAKADWKCGRFGLIPGDDREFIPLPA